MRAPWRFLTDLVSRKPQPKALEYRPVEQENTSPISAAPQTESTEGEGTVANRAMVGVIDAAAVASNPDRLVERGPDDLLTSTAQPDEVSAFDTVRRDGNVEAAEPEAQNAPDVEIQQTNVIVAKTNQPKKTRRRSHEAAAEQPAPISAASAPSQPRLHDQMLSLDDEIRKLRHELAQKLTVQNEQLRTLIDRYKRD